MKQFLVVFGSLDGIKHGITSSIVNLATDGDDYTGHVFLLFPKLVGWNAQGFIEEYENVIVEAVWPEVTLTNGTAYDGSPHIFAFKVECEDHVYDSIAEKAYELAKAHIPYGLVTDCSSGAIFDISARFVGDERAKKLCDKFNDKIDTSQTMNCSEVASTCMRKGWWDFCGDIPSGNITPKRMFNNFVNDSRIKKVAMKIGPQVLVDLLNE